MSRGASSVQPVSRYAFDHVSIGVKDGISTLSDLRRRIGLTPLAGERLPHFRYVLNRVGDATSGMQLELIEEQGGESSFMHRFLARKGEGVHHLTFTVPDVEQTIEDVARAGFQVVQIDLEHPPWREAFIMPTESGLGVVIQFADSTHEYPSMPEFMDEVLADPESVPHNKGGQDRYWWRDVRENVDSGPKAYLRRVEMSSELPDRIIGLLTHVLGGEALTTSREFTDVVWGKSVIRVLPSESSGVHTLVYSGGPSEGFSIGSVRFVREDQ